MITPTRFGLKYAPVPTLALEYEDDVAGVDDNGGGTSLYVYASDHSRASSQRMKKLHVVELPALTRQSEAVAVARQLQRDNRRFLAPDVVKEDQLVRLLERLMAHLQATELSVSTPPPVAPTKTMAMAGTFGSHDVAKDASESDVEEEASELEESALDESIEEASATLDDSHADHDDNKEQSRPDESARSSFCVATAARDADESDNDDDDEKDKDTPSPAPRAAPAPDDAQSDGESEEDTEVTKTKTTTAAAGDAAAPRSVARSESASEAASDDDVQSEELEYFSEDGSDEDSF